MAAEQQRSAEQSRAGGRLRDTAEGGEALDSLAECGQRRCVLRQASFCGFCGGVLFFQNTSRALVEKKQAPMMRRHPVAATSGGLAAAAPSTAAAAATVVYRMLSFGEAVREQSQLKKPHAKLHTAMRP